MRRITPRPGDRDAGSAMVAALAVAIIGVSLATLVVGRAITVARDAGRDETRTAEIHSAEAAIDTTLYELESSSPCVPAVDGQVLGTGNEAVVIEAVIEYRDETGVTIDCTGTDLGVAAYSATLDVTATAANPTFGIDPERTMRASLVLEPNTSVIQGVNSAIFSATGLTTTSGFTVSPSTSGVPGDVWVESGDWNCQNNLVITGSLYVVQGSADFGTSGCVVQGDMYVAQDVSYNNNQSHNTVEGNLTVHGNVDAQHDDTGIGGNALIGGSVVTGSLAVGGWIEEGATSIPTLAPAGGLPELPYVEQDWIDDGFDIYTKAEFHDHAGLDISKECEIGSNDIVLPPDGAGPGLYDLRDCVLSTDNKGTITLRDDTALMVEGFSGGNRLVISSTDGEHELFLIVPYPGTAGGNLEFHANTDVTPDTEIFLYTPNAIDFNNNTITYGQIYGGHVTVSAHQHFYFSQTEVPGSTITSSEETKVIQPGFAVTIVAKQEVN